MSSLLNFHDPSQLRRLSAEEADTDAVPAAENGGLEELKSQPVWICWNFREKDGRKTKVPCAASGDKIQKAVRGRTWRPRSTAAKAPGAWAGKGDGLTRCPGIKRKAT